MTRPLGFVGVWVVLAAVCIVFDRLAGPVGQLVRASLAVVVPPQAATMFLSTVAPGLLTVISIIFFVALMAVQHQSGKYSPVVLDQFLRRRVNQLFFGMFVGLTLYCLLAIGLVPQGQAIVSGTVGLVASVVTLVLLLAFIYSTVDQMRPSAVAWMLQAMAIRARRRQQPLLARTRPEPRLAGRSTTHVLTDQIGYLIDIDAQMLASALAGEDEVEIELLVSMGEHLVADGHVADIRGGTTAQRRRLADAVLAALTLGRLRDIDHDASHAVNQLANVAWSATAVAGDPESARVAVEALHGVLAQFHTPGEDHDAAEDHGGPLPVVYADPLADNVINGTVNVIAAADVSKQHQSAADAVTVLARALPQLAGRHQQAVLDRLERVLPTMSDHLYTIELENSFALLRRAMHEAGVPQSAKRLNEIMSELYTKTRLAEPD